MKFKLLFTLFSIAILSLVMVGCVDVDNEVQEPELPQVIPGTAGDPMYEGEDHTFASSTLTGPLDFGSGSLSINTQGNIVLSTENSGTGAQKTRVTISGSVANSADADITWANSAHKGLKLGGTMNANDKVVQGLKLADSLDANSKDITSVATASFIDGGGIATGIANNDIAYLWAVDNDSNTLVPVARITGTTVPYFGAGGASGITFRFLSDGTADFNNGAVQELTTSGTTTFTGYPYLNQSGTPSPVLEGTLYYNSTVNCLFFYNGSTWTATAAY